MTASWAGEVFDRIYAGAADPWDVETSAYERAKYDSTLAALPNRRYGRGLEIGCSIGAQTVRLAERCDSLLAVDVAAEAVRRTRVRCAHLPGVTVCQARIPGEWPPGCFDLIVFSEVLYFLSAPDIGVTARAACKALSSAGAVLLVNWTGFTNTPTTGAEAASLFVAACDDRLVHALDQPAECYRIDLLTGPSSQAS